MTLTTTVVRDISPIGHDEAMDLAAAEYDRFGALLRGLAPGDWDTPTVCDRWDVRAVAAHVLGAAEACASVGENIHQMRLGRRVQRQLGLGHIVHGANEVQVRERAGLDPAELIGRWDRAVPRALRGRRKFPPLLRPVRIGFEAPLGRRPLGYLMDIVYTRAVRAAVETVMPVSRLRWIAFAHLEADECGAEQTFHQTSLGPAVPATYRRLADLEPRQLAIMHGSAYAGDCPALLRAMADVYEQQFGCGATASPA